MSEIFEFFKSEAIDGDIIIRSEAMTKLRLIGALMGPERVRNELIPFLKTCTGDMDQVLLILASVLGEFLSLVGGPEYASEIAALLERLCCFEDVGVRTTAATSICKILSSLNDKHEVPIQTYFELFQRLCNEEGEVFYGRMSACQISSEIYRLLSTTNKAIVLELYGKLISDELSMVRRGAGLHFLKLVEAIDHECSTVDMAKMMKIMISDDHLTVRALAYDNIGPFAIHMKRLNAPVNVMTDLSGLIRNAVDDYSWKIRQAVAKNSALYPSSFAPTTVATQLFPAVLSLIQDAEPDVRISSIDGLANYVSPVGPANFLMEFIPTAQHLADDLIPGVRKALSDACIQIATAVSKEGVDCQPIFDIITKLAQDDDPLVRLRFLKKLGVIAAETPALCVKLTDILKRLFKDTNWRVRKLLGSAMADVLKHMGSDYFCEHFLNDFLLLFKDDVDEVRLECAKTLPGMSSSSNSAWVFEKIFPTVRSLSTDSVFSRLCMLFALEGLLSLGELTDSSIAEITDLIVFASKDTVPNIRLRVAQVLGKSSGSFRTEVISSRVRAILSELEKDKDKDVQYFASMSLKLLRPT